MRDLNLVEHNFFPDFNISNCKSGSFFIYNAILSYFFFDATLKQKKFTMLSHSLRKIKK